MITIRKIIGRQKRRLPNSGQATTELAIFVFIILTAFATFLSYGQNMNQQQDISMHAFRQALNKANADYAGGSGFGGSSYTAMSHIHIVDLFNKYYDGSQRTVVSGGATALWDPDLMNPNRDISAGPNTYVQVDDIETNLGPLGEDESILNISTNHATVAVAASETYRVSSGGVNGTVNASAEEHLDTTIQMESGSNVTISQDNSFPTNDSWSTSW